MIQKYEHQKEPHEIRLDLKTIESMLTNLRTDVTKCAYRLHFVDMLPYFSTSMNKGKMEVL